MDCLVLYVQWRCHCLLTFSPMGWNGRPGFRRSGGGSLRLGCGALRRPCRGGNNFIFVDIHGLAPVATIRGPLGADRTASVLVAENHAGIVGFVAAVPSVRDFYRRFYLRRGIAVLVAAAPKLVRPSVVRRLIETARYPSATGSLPDAELLAIAVDGSARARGLGTALASDALADLRRRGVERIKVVVADDNAPANRLYERVGFGLATAVSVHGGRRSNVWVWASPS